MTASWPARRAGDRILCGRQAAGRYVCQGELAAIEWIPMPAPVPSPVAMLTLPSGYAEDPPGSHHWRRTARAQRQAASGRVATGVARREAGRMAGPDTAAPFVTRGFPGPSWTRECPHCGSLALVTSALLKS